MLSRPLAGIALGLVSASASAQSISFETPDEQKSPVLVTQNATAVPQNAYATDGTKSIFATFPVKPAGTFSKVRVNTKNNWDITDAGGVAVDISNPTAKTVDFGVTIYDKAGKTQGFFTSIEPNGSGTYLARTDTSYLQPLAYGMAALPNPYPGIRTFDVIPAAGFDPKKIIRIEVFMRGGRTAVDYLNIDYIRVMPKVDINTLLTGMIDDMGQYAKATWPGKLASAADLPRQDWLEQGDLLQNRYLPDRDFIGARKKGPYYPATGFFTTLKVDGKWWLQSPQGKPFWFTGLSGVRTDSNETNITAREYMFKSVPERNADTESLFMDYTGVTRGPSTEGVAFNFLEYNLQRKYGKIDWFEPWAKRMLRRLPSWGFNGIGKGSDMRLYSNKTLPFVANVMESGDYNRVDCGKTFMDGPLADPWDPGYRKGIEAAMKRQAKVVDGNPLCVGFIIGNEPSFLNTTALGDYGLAYGAMRQDSSTSPAKKTFVKMLKEKYGSVLELSLAWGLSIEHWSTLESPIELSLTPNAAMKEDMADFVKEYARAFFRVGRETVKKYAPDYMYLGASIYLFNADILEAAAEFCDVVTLNLYGTGVDENRFGVLRQIDKPFMISEYHFGATDRGGFHPGLIVAQNQDQRAKMWQSYLREVIDHPSFVGASWYRTYDRPNTGETYTAENYACGFLDVTDTPMPEMRAMARSLNGEIYRRRW